MVNLLPVCERHHYLVHEGGWTLTLSPDHTATWTHPGGSVHWVGTTIDRTLQKTARTARVTWPDPAWPGPAWPGFTCL